MAVYGKWTARFALQVGAVGLLASGLVGCNRGGEPAAEAPVVVPGNPAAAQEAVVQAAKIELRLHQPFTEATIADQPDQYLPEMTLTGKSVGKLYEQVVKHWDSIHFLNAQGQKLHYTATIQTDLGEIEIDLQPELAPNHVRNFVALAQCGYYDGLVFERTIAEQLANDPASRVELIEGGCPTGTGNVGFGSIGYWLRPEFSEGVSHDEGAVGACLGEDPLTAACRFYITLSKAPVIDGERTIFGKVSRGLDVVRRIATQPVINSPEFPLGDRPDQPVVIKKVAIQARPLAPTTVAQQPR